MIIPFFLVRRKSLQLPPLLSAAGPPAQPQSRRQQHSQADQLAPLGIVQPAKTGFIDKKRDLHRLTAFYPYIRTNGPNRCTQYTTFSQYRKQTKCVKYT